MTDVTRWGIPLIHSKNRAVDKKRKEITNKEIDRLTEENNNLKTIIKDQKKKLQELEKKAKEQLDEFRNKGEL